MGHASRSCAWNSQCRFATIHNTHNSWWKSLRLDWSWYIRMHRGERWSHSMDSARSRIDSRYPDGCHAMGNGRRRRHDIRSLDDRSWCNRIATPLNRYRRSHRYISHWNCNQVGRNSISPDRSRAFVGLWGRRWIDCVQSERSTNTHLEIPCNSCTKRSYLED